jgi:GGDEF domain-containing protein
VFGSLVDKPASVARIGGDEFAVLLSATDIAGGEAVLATLAGLIELNNQYYPDFELSISTGIATGRPVSIRSVDRRTNTEQNGIWLRKRTNQLKSRPRRRRAGLDLNSRSKLVHSTF